MSLEELDKKLVSASENGQTISPILAEGVKNYLIDIDGTICDDIPNEEPERMLTAAVYPDALITLNKWYDEGHVIFFFTSRTEEHRAVTETWLQQHGFKYHGMVMGKPRGGNYHWIDTNHLNLFCFLDGFLPELLKQNHLADLTKTIHPLLAHKLHPSHPL